ncbi:MAG TPA: hypothetical protein PLE30_02170 [Candidatus Kapabacteria bacterium]|nr:hypothetical protein [Candidatus Kapabacteria bacterium]
MNNCPEEQIKLTAKINDNLEIIQKLFQDYQDKYFTVRSAEFFCLELNGEAGELANLEKKLWKGRDIDITLVADEAADVFIALMNYCNARGINLEEAVINKLNIIENKRAGLESIGKKY